MSDPIIIHEDKQEVIKTAKTKYSSNWIRHIDVKSHAVRDAADTGKIRMAHLETRDHHAEILKKALERN